MCFHIHPKQSLLIRGRSQFSPVFVGHLFGKRDKTRMRNLTLHFTDTLPQEVFLGPKVSRVRQLHFSQGFSFKSFTVGRKRQGTRSDDNPGISTSWTLGGATSFHAHSNYFCYNHSFALNTFNSVNLYLG